MVDESGRKVERADRPATGGIASAKWLLCSAAGNRGALWAAKSREDAATMMDFGGNVTMGLADARGL